VSAAEVASRIGFVGLGDMGSLIAGHILKSGREVVGWDLRPEAVRAFAEAGGIAARDVTDVAVANTVISMVFDDRGARDLTLGSGGLAERLKPGSVHVMMASLSPPLSTELANAHADHGQHYIAAPVFGRVEAAAAADLKVVCSGDEATFRRVAPILGVLGTVRWVGPDAHQSMLVKSVGNAMIYTAIETLREMFEVLSAGGVSQEAAREILIDGLFPGQIFGGYAQMYMNHPDALHMTDLARKDRRNCLAAADELRVAMPLVRYLHEQDLP
jgi:3-hydroxyisobutyrate dehydrogenase-like beta-hydroxyacid dehydrogenase